MTAFGIRVVFLLAISLLFLNFLFFWFFVGIVVVVIFVLFSQMICIFISSIIVFYKY